MTTQELLDALGIDRTTLRKWIDKGLPHKRKGRAYDFDADTVQAWLIAQGLATPANVAATRDDVAAHFGVHVRTVAGWLAAGCPGRPGYFDLDAITAWRDANRPAPAPATDAAQARLLAAKADREELRLAKERSELIPIEIVTRLFARHISEAAAILDQLPDLCLAALPPDTPPETLAALRGRLVAAVDNARQSLADTLEAEDLNPA